LIIHLNGWRGVGKQTIGRALAERIGRKLTDTAVLEEFFNIDKVHRPDVPELLVLDVTHLAPQEAAERIIAHASALGLTNSGSDAE
jgi:cytidylate kinase